ncbi:hypothetical protein BI291_13180 [Thalassotalea sp. PP2-459]|nr:hypothetical protein BI291_13180 [Thalassotalea sp. PP2-459]
MNNQNIFSAIEVVRNRWINIKIKKYKALNKQYGAQIEHTEYSLFIYDVNFFVMLMSFSLFS